MTIRKYLLSVGVLSIFLCPALLQAQSNLTKSKKFFKQNLSEYREWLDDTGMDQLLKVDRYKIIDNKFVLLLESGERYGNPEHMSKAWADTRVQFQEAYGMSPEKILLQKLSHVMELNPEEVRVEITTSSPGVFSITAEYKDGKLAIDDTIDGTVRGNTDKLILKLDEMGFFASTDAISIQGQIREVKDRLRDGLRDFFLQSDSKFNNEPKVEFIRDGDDEFTLMISNVTNQIITRYFELINLNIELTGEEGEFEISYSVFGKYSSGIFSAPRATSSDYTDMFPEFSAEIDLYVDKLGQTISSILKSS